MAIRLSRRRFDNEKDAEAFLKEPRVAAKLEHAHIAPVYDAGRNVEGSFFVVCKFLEGGNLKKLIARGRPT